MSKDGKNIPGGSDNLPDLTKESGNGNVVDDAHILGSIRVIKPDESVTNIPLLRGVAGAGTPVQIVEMEEKLRQIQEQIRQGKKGDQTLDEPSVDLQKQKIINANEATKIEAIYALTHALVENALRKSLNIPISKRLARCVLTICLIT